MNDQTAYTVLITYQAGTGYSAEPMQQLALDLAEYTEEGAREQAEEALTLNPAIERFIINVLPGGTQIK